MTNEDILYLAQQYDNNIDDIKNKGVVFTPISIVDKIINYVKPNINQTICEPSAGKGIFIFRLIDYFFYYTDEEIINFINNNLYAYDINPEYIDFIKKHLPIYLENKGIKGEVILDNIQCQNYLETNLNYDVIIGNPPYVKVHNIDKENLKNLRRFKSLDKNGNIDLYYAFIEKALNDADKVSYIVPNGFIKNTSGKTVRNLLLNRIKIIEDFGIRKIWSNISTYTCIFLAYKCSEEISYNNKVYDMPRKDNKWVFSLNDGGKNLSDLINYISIGVQTSANNVFLIEEFDEHYGYKNEHKIELGICKKVIYATNHRKFSNHKYILYPYDENNVPLELDYIKSVFPNAYQYLLSNKEQLESRNLNHNIWYIFGRNQGLLKPKIDKQIILPLLFLKPNTHYIEIPSNEQCVVLKGILVDIKSDEFIKIISSDKFIEYIESNNKCLPGKKGTDEKWLSLTSNSIKKYKY
jgi:adenine-specific DNA-methyltransferase